MEINKLIFPSPTPSYNSSLDGLFYIETPQEDSGLKEISQNLDKCKIKAIVLGNNQKNTQIQTKKHYIPCLFLKKACLHNGLILYFHGNAEDIGMSINIARELSLELQMAILCVEYPGYGIYQGECSSDEMIKDGYQVMEYVTKLVSENNIIIIGRSIGTGIAVELATKYKNIKCLVLISPFTSLQDVIKHLLFTWISKLVKQRFRNLEKMDKIKSPVLFLHGRNDTIIPYQQSEQLMEKCQSITELKIQDEMSHNSFFISVHLTIPLKSFLRKLDKYN